MTRLVESFKCQLGALPSEARAELASFLLGTLEPVEEQAEEAWGIEVRRRVEEIRTGRAEGTPAEQVFAELRARLG